MKGYGTYLARADAKIARDVANTASPFTIEVRFLGGLTDRQMEVFKGAADRWARMIVGDLPSVQVDGEVIDDLLILAGGEDIDGPGQILGQAGPTHLRPAGAGAAAHLPAKGVMAFDTADLTRMEKEGTLVDVITHEMGHVIGVGTIWKRKGLLNGAGKANPTFTGKKAMEEYGKLKGTGGSRRVPVENTHGPGTRDSHWRETIFRNELMSGFVEAADNPISRVTVASLQDLGYEVNIDAAEPYTLPNLVSLAEQGRLVAHVAPIDNGMVFGTVPLELPEDSLTV